MTCFWVWSNSHGWGKGHRIRGQERQAWDEHLTKSAVTWSQEKRNVIKNAWLFYRAQHGLNIFPSPSQSPPLYCFFFVDVFQSQSEPKAFIVHMHRASPRLVFCKLWKIDKRTRLNITCSHQRWFQEKRGPDVYEVRPSRGSHVGVGTGPFPSSHSPVGCPCEREEGRMLGQGYLWELACYCRHVLQNWDDRRLIKPLQIKHLPMVGRK